MRYTCVTVLEGIAWAVARLSKAWRPQGSPLLYDGSTSHFTRMYSSGDPCGRHARMHQMLLFLTMQQPWGIAWAVATFFFPTTHLKGDEKWGHPLHISVVSTERVFTSST